MAANKNLDGATIASFGNEWMHFDQTGMLDGELEKIFESYFSLFPWSDLPPSAEGFDMGSGSGRWAKCVAPRVGKLHCIDPSKALEVSRRNLEKFDNVEFHSASVDDDTLAPASQDFGYSLGVLHHIPDTGAALKSCTNVLKSGAPFLLYLYYRFDNKPAWFRLIWRLSEVPRAFVSRLPDRAKPFFTDPLAAIIYWPLARGAKLLENAGISVDNIPLSAYRDCSFYTMRTDSRDRFGTPLEQRFTRDEIRTMMQQADLRDIEFRDNVPYWVAVGYKK